MKTRPHKQNIRSLLAASGLYVLFDPRTRSDWCEQLCALADVGVYVMQLRAKGATLQQLQTWAKRLQQLRNFPALVLLNDHPRLAAQLGFAGVHVGRKDASAAEARLAVGPEALVGVSAQTVEQLQELAGVDVDYVGCGAYRATPSKNDIQRILGLVGLRELVAVATQPVVAIGGIVPTDVAQLKQAGVAGIAVYSAIWLAEQPAQAARAFVRAWQTTPLPA